MIDPRGATGIRLLLVGVPDSELLTAAAMARDAGADVVLADSAADALAIVREAGVDVAMIEVGADVAGFIRDLRRERMAIPVFACGIDALAVLAVAAIRAGAQDYLPLPPDRDLIVAAIVSVARGDCVVVGSDPAFEQGLRLGLRFARSQVPILISGETGCGKQLVARAIHRASGRTGRFIVVDCADINPRDLESELFGHDKGAFPDSATLRSGCIRQAANGTLFLKQIAVLPLTVQPRIASLLGDCGSRPDAEPGSARIIASSSIDLSSRVEAGMFRANLLASLTLVQVSLPPLRDRRGDIASLSQHFVHRFAALDGVREPRISASALQLLEGRRWPDNIRELEHVMHRAVLLATSGTVEIADLMLADGSTLADGPTLVGRATPKPETGNRLRALVGSTVEDVERALILETLRHCRGNRTTASSILGISVRTMRNKLKAFIEHGALGEVRA